MNEVLEDYIISGDGAPTDTTVAPSGVGQFYRNRTNNTYYKCTEIIGSKYTWKSSVINLTYPMN